MYHSMAIRVPLYALLRRSILFDLGRLSRRYAWASKGLTQVFLAQGTRPCVLLAVPGYTPELSGAGYS